MSSCSFEALTIGEPLPGTAPSASAWIVIEQAGPWGRSALVDSQLDQRIAEHLSSAGDHGIAVLLARRPGGTTTNGPGPRHVWLARSVVGGQLLRHRILDDISELLSWDLAAIGAGVLPAFGSIERRPTTFVCTHSKRDRCCAVEGRAIVTSLVDEADAATRERIWECSHIGGHRFAPALLSLPSGAVYGRLGPSEAHQVAAIAVMRSEGLDRDDQLDVLKVVSGRAVPVPVGRPLAVDAGADTVEAEVRHVDGRSWRAVMTRIPLSGTRRESCAKEPVAGVSWECTSLLPAPAWS